ncbi:MAG: ATP-dependent DNA helicase RecG [Endomicrobium sp.]|jgi:ATP-dependent DNA helicase RecG|nr:ATP-dependent DNA helicase RecG [Endomicrobium sp.]
MIRLDSEVQYIKGIGPKRAQSLLRLGIKNVSDLLTFFPSQYQDRTHIVSVSDAYKDKQCCICGRVGISHERKLSAGLFLLDIEIFDNTGMAYIRFFRKKNPYSKIDVFASIRKAFEPGKTAYIFGDTKIEAGARYISVNDYEIRNFETEVPLFFNKIIPVYPATEGLNQKVIREAVKNALDTAVNLYPDISAIIPEIKNIPKISSYEAIRRIHYPQTLDDAENARRAFAVQEFFVLESALAISKNRIKNKSKNRRYEIKKTFLTAFRQNLKFEFTKSQKKAINDIFADMQSALPMNRILMGDVGSGKTVVALSAVLLTCENGFQSMIAAPTEILAEQHFLTISNMLAGLDINIVLVTSSTMKKKTEREKILSASEKGSALIIIGTHALMEERIKFKNLALIVVDEQHRFGVMQKHSALDKTDNPDTLMMTATPIPRALAMTVYGEMDMTVIDELPPGRIPIKTRFTSESEAYYKTISELQNGGQAYIVYPLIDESDKIALKSAISETEKLSQSYFKNYRVGLLHGKMKPSEKNEIMEKFKNKNFDILVSTTVIEVGIDVPNASVMIIQHADRFGLSALHQLRGRIGRGKKQSYCFLVGNLKSKAAAKRLKIMTETNNGFKIAEEDLRMRGPGELIGTVQHGFPEFKAGDLIKDADIVDFAKDSAVKLIDQDSQLIKKEHSILKMLINQRFSDKVKLIGVG